MYILKWKLNYLTNNSYFDIFHVGIVHFEKRNIQVPGNQLVMMTTFSVAPDYKAKRAYLFGDVKTFDNIDKFVSNLVDRRLTLNEHNETTSVFKDAIDQMMCVPGDWHAGLLMLQSIMNIFWDGFLQPIGMKCLGWKRIQKDARNYYFKDSRLVMYVCAQLSDVLMQSFTTKEVRRITNQF